MKIKTMEMDYDSVVKLPHAKHHKPLRPNFFLKSLIRILSAMDLGKVDFDGKTEGMEKLGKKEPCLILMNHSSFIDLEIVSYFMYPKSYQIVCTSDGFVGKEGLMRHIGCIPTQKFVTDINLLKDMSYALKELKTSVLMYPEASYSFDGTETPLPKSLGKCIKMLKVPVVMIKTEGAFSRDPLFNMLQKRKVKVSATMKYLFSPEDIEKLSKDEIDEKLSECFSYDHFRWQQTNKVKIDEPFRADGLNRVLYKCPDCLTEGKMVGKGTKLFCENCKKSYTLDEYGYLRSDEGEGKFDHVPDWFMWERKMVRDELLDGSYKLDIPVDIYMMVDRKAVYKVGEGRLLHTTEGFHLTGCDGKLDYSLKPSASYSLYSDYFWYEIGDMICIGDMKTSYYCFPKNAGDVVAKTRLAAEELYKIDREKR